MKKLFALLLCLALLPLNVPLVRADDNDIFGANIQPNVMLFIDTSGSMDDTILADPYDIAVTYTGTRTPTVVYKYESKKYSLYKNTVNEVTGDNSAETTAIRDALNTGGTWSGKIGKTNYSLYLGNYLNWLATPGAQQVKKIVIAKQVYTNLINAVDGVRFGLARFTGNSSQGPGGAQVLAPMGSTKATLLAAVSSLTASGYTPLGGALRDIGKYYTGQGDFSGAYATSPIQYECQPNFAILMTDGLENGTVKLAPQATLRRTQDHSTTWPGTQNVIVDTIGFALSDADKADGANDILQTAATNGGGTFYNTDSQTALEEALQDAIRRIIAATYTFATPVIPTTSATGLDRAYLAAVQSDPSRPFWHGFVKAYNRDSTGKVPTDVNGVPDVNALAWEAGQKLTEQTAAARTIYAQIGATLTGNTLSGGTRQSFSTANSNLTEGLLDVSTSADRDKVINFLRGVDVLDQSPANGNAAEDREWKLGDIFHATPVVVTPPFLPSTDTTYHAFRTAQASRTTVVIVASNDGIIHAFRETDGVELWAFIPPDILSKLKSFVVPTGDHEFLLDSSPIAADVKIGGVWKTILVFGERRGGKWYHAVDITDTTNPTYLWGFTDPEIAESWSEPIIGKVKMNSATGSTEKYVAIFGGGYDTEANNQHGRGLFVVDIATGSKLWEYKTNASAGAICTSTSCSGNADRAYMNFSIPASPLALDLNTDGYIDRVYIGDIGGQMWKFDLSEAATLTGGTSGTVNNWTGKRFFKAGNETNPPTAGEFFPTQAIYGTANAALDENHALWIYFGTGDRNHPNNAAANRFYGIKDATNMTNGSAYTEAPSPGTTTSGIVVATAVTAAPTVGWYYLLSSTNKEKILASADVFNKIVYFTSFSPSATVTCGGSGIAKLYAVQMTTAFAAIDFANDVAYATSGGSGGGGGGTVSDATTERGENIGSGIPSKPVITLTDTGADIFTAVVAGKTDGTLSTNPAPPPNFMRRILYWREAF